MLNDVRHIQLTCLQARLACSYFTKAQPCGTDFTHPNWTQVTTYHLLLSSFVRCHVQIKVNNFYLLKKYPNSSDIENIFVPSDTIIKKGGNSFLLNLASSVLYGSESWYTWLIVRYVPVVLPSIPPVTVSFPFVSMKHRYKVSLWGWFTNCVMAMQVSQSCYYKPSTGIKWNKFSCKIRRNYLTFFLFLFFFGGGVKQTFSFILLLVYIWFRLWTVT